jgi:murein DD-endopeptidase MepM/ murein hydrolase activator NlpD
MFVATHQFHPIIMLPSDYEVYDFTQGYDPDRNLQSEYGIGRYAEERPGMYTGELFEEERRTVHMGIDIAAPLHTSVYSFADGEIFLFGNNDKPFDYGPTIITKHTIEGITIFALFGHLSKDSLIGKEVGQTISAGQEIAHLGMKSENGGWNPHLHFQLSLIEPETFDLPGVVHKSKLEWARRVFPDPQIVLGTLYPS